MDHSILKLSRLNHEYRDIRVLQLSASDGRLTGSKQTDGSNGHSHRHFTRSCVSLAKETVVGRPNPVLRRRDVGYADRLVLAIHVFGECKTQKYWQIVNKLNDVGSILDMLDIDREEQSDTSMLCKTMDLRRTAVCRALLDRTTPLQELGGVAAIDSTSFDRLPASQ